MSVERSFYQTPCIEINTARLDHLNKLQLPLEKKTVLEVGSGPGLLTHFFTEKGCKTLSLEGRKENVDAFKINNPNSEAIVFDCESSDWSSIKQADICFCYGLLYHLSTPFEFLRNVSTKVKEFIIIETAISNGASDNGINIVDESIGDYAQALNGFGCRPTRKFLWDALKSIYPYVYMPVFQPEHEDFPKSYTNGGTQRMIVIGSNIPLNNTMLSDSFVESY
jgi:hypothetical protein